MCTRAKNRDIADTLCVKRLFTERAAPDLHAVIACPAVQQWRHRPAQRVEASGRRFQHSLQQFRPKQMTYSRITVLVLKIIGKEFPDLL